MDTCHYCGRQYHPMPVYTAPGARIHVCHLKYTIDDTTDEMKLEQTNCRVKAKAEGYQYRRNLTPTR